MPQAGSDRLAQRWEVKVAGLEERGQARTKNTCHRRRNHEALPKGKLLLPAVEDERVRAEAKKWGNESCDDMGRKSGRRKTSRREREDGIGIEEWYSNDKKRGRRRKQWKASEAWTEGGEIDKGMDEEDADARAGNVKQMKARIGNRKVVDHTGMMRRMGWIGDGDNWGESRMKREGMVMEWRESCAACKV
ncbi:hypothetical protein B0H13DRAFT_1899238 [Mycena leptocephala]|nr:hypothetical protein B0H13DRAFT_1899238 [Mycena leptocephala]